MPEDQTIQALSILTLSLLFGALMLQIICQEQVFNHQTRAKLTELHNMNDIHADGESMEQFKST